MTDFNELYQKYLNNFNTYLDDFIKDLKKSSNSLIVDTCIYSLNNGGKRIRPILFLSACDMLGVKNDKYKNLSIAIELIHSYSLVHDDLPCMDDDDYRRGKLSTHKKFGEAYGVLCGDAMLNLSIETALSCPDNSNEFLNAIKLLFNYSGVYGMIYGQTLDLLAETNSNRTLSELYEIYLNKTAKLITAPLLMASLLSGGKYYNQLKEIGYNLGYLFQIQDDVLDETSDVKTLGKTPGKDKASNKLTAVSILGLKKAKELLKKHYDIILINLEKIPNSNFLLEFVNKIYLRTY